MKATKQEKKHRAILAKNILATILNRDFQNSPYYETMCECLKDIEKEIGEGNQPPIKSILNEF